MFKFDKKFLVLPIMICLMFATLCTFGFAGCSTEKLTVTLDADGGYFVVGGKTEKTIKIEVDAGQKIPSESLTTPKHDSDTQYVYTFDVWDFNLTDNVINKSMTVKAKWTKTDRLYTVTFDANGGTYTNGQETQETIEQKYTYNATLTKPANPTREADNEYTYEFNGYDAEVSDKVTQSITYVAQWETVTRYYTVTFNAGDGVFAAGDGVSTDNKTFTMKVTYNTTPDTSKLPKPACDSDTYFTYEFDGWTVDAITKDDTTYNATYTKKAREYTATFYKSQSDTTKAVYTTKFKAVKDGTPTLTAAQYAKLTTDCENAGISDEGFVSSWNITLTNSDTRIYIDQAFVRGDGTEANPYKINDLATFEAMMSKLNASYKAYTNAPSEATEGAKTKSDILSEASNVYYKMTADVDFKGYEGGTCSWFVGHLDAKKPDSENYAIKGMNPDMFVKSAGAIFDDIYNATVSNLDIILSDKIVSFACVARGDSVTFDNVNVRNATNGAVTLITSDDNNESAYVCFSKATSMTFKDCTNYANYVSEASYFGIFLGGYTYGKDANDVSITANHLTYENCVNNGNVRSSDSVGLLYGNPWLRNFTYSTDATNTVTVTNCVNNGVIVARGYGNFVGFYDNSETDKEKRVTETIAKALADKVATGTSGKFTKIHDVNATLNNGDEFVLTAKSGTLDAGKYVLTLVKFASSDSGTVRVNYSYTVNLTEGATSIDFGARYDFIDLTNYNKLPNHVTFESADWKRMTGYDIYYAIDENSKYIVFDFSKYYIKDYTLLNTKGEITGYTAYVSYYESTTADVDTDNAVADETLSKANTYSVSAYSRADVATADALKTAITEKKQIINVTAELDLTTNEKACDSISGISVDYDCIINFGGHTVKVDKGFDLASTTKTAKLTLNNGKLLATYWAAWVQNNGVLTLNDIEVTTTDYQATIFAGGDASNAKTYNPQVILNNGAKVYNTFGTTNANNVTSAIALFDGATLTMNNGSFVHYGYTGEATVDTGAGVYVRNANVTINSGAIVDAKGFGVYAEQGANVTINGRVVSTQYALVTNGFDANASGSTISVNAGGEVVSTRSTAMYIASKDVVKISGGKIHGATALYIKSGNVTVTGGTFMAWLDKTSDYAYMNSGCHATGDAIVVDACGYATGAPTVTITTAKDGATGAKFELAAKNAQNIRYVQYNNSTTGTVTVNGTEKAAEKVEAIKA